MKTVKNSKSAPFGWGVVARIILKKTAQMNKKHSKFSNYFSKFRNQQSTTKVFLSHGSQIREGFRKNIQSCPHLPQTNIFSFFAFTRLSNAFAMIIFMKKILVQKKWGGHGPPRPPRFCRQ